MPIIPTDLIDVNDRSGQSEPSRKQIKVCLRYQRVINNNTIQDRLHTMTNRKTYGKNHRS